MVLGGGVRSNAEDGANVLFSNNGRSKAIDNNNGTYRIVGRVILILGSWGRTQIGLDHCGHDCWTAIWFS